MTHPTPDLRAVIDASRGGDDPDRDDRARVRSALITKLGAAAFVTGAAATTTSTAVASTVAASVTPYLVALALTSALGVGAVATWRTRTPPPARAPIAAPHTTPARVEPAPVNAPSPAVTVIAAPASATPVDEPRTTPRARPARPVGEGIESVPLEEAPDLVAETAALREAHVAMEAGDPERALRVLAGYSSAHRGGALRVEREAAKLIAQCQLGRARELEVSSFLTHHASSPLAARVGRACLR